MQVKARVGDAAFVLSASKHSLDPSPHHLITSSPHHLIPPTVPKIIRLDVLLFPFLYLAVTYLIPPCE